MPVLKIGAIALVFLIGFTSGWFGRYGYIVFSNRTPNACQLTPIRQPGYEYINPLLICETAGKANFALYQPLQKKLETYLQDRKMDDKLIDASIYFRDVNAGQWISIDDTVRYAPASLLKVPVMIATLHYAESHPDFLQKKIFYAAPLNSFKPNFPPSHPLVPGTTYTIDELLHEMIAYSDNNALSLIVNNLDLKFLSDVYTDLGLIVPPDPITPEQIDFITLKSYSYFFRVIFNSTYLSREMSQKATSLLMDSDFHDGILSALPADVKVAHKFGERMNAGNPITAELHECGIIYIPDHPYMLCVMTKGHDFQSLKTVLHDVSDFVYQEMVKKYPFPN